jgi:hypothetical protein
MAELKSVERFHPAHQKQVLADLRLTGIKLRYVCEAPVKP